MRTTSGGSSGELTSRTVAVVPELWPSKPRLEVHLPNMSKKLTPTKATITTKEKVILDDTLQNDLSTSAAEEGDMEHFLITRYQTALTVSLMTILEMMERKNADKEEKWHEKERRRRVEEYAKEEW